MARVSSSRLIRSEDIESQLRELLEEGREAGRRAEAAAVRAGDEALPLSNQPDNSDSLLSQMRDALEDEIVVAKPATGETVIERTEQDREIAKRALMHIKTPQLRNIAQELGGGRGGKVDELLERIVRSYGTDQEQIARLVVEYEAEPPPQRRLTTRIFHIWESESDLTEVGRRVESFSRRYRQREHKSDREEDNPSWPQHRVDTERRSEICQPAYSKSTSLTPSALV
jgi:hypothetical protein